MGVTTRMIKDQLVSRARPISSLWEDPREMAQKSFQVVSSSPLKADELPLATQDISNRTMSRKRMILVYAGAWWQQWRSAKGLFWGKRGVDRLGPLQILASKRDHRHGIWI